MTKRFCVGFAALAFALLLSPAARASFIYENVNLNFGDGYTATGNLTFRDIPNFMGSGSPLFPLCISCTPAPVLELYFHGSPLTPLPDYGSAFIGLGNPTGEPLIFYSPFPPSQVTFSSTTDRLPTTYADFFLDGTPAVSGDVLAGTAVPLPAALPLFGGSLVLLAFLAMGMSRRSPASRNG